MLLMILGFVLVAIIIGFLAYKKGYNDALHSAHKTYMKDVFLGRTLD